MTGRTAVPDQRVIAAYLDDVEAELNAAARLAAPPPSRFAAFHLQQAAEKLVKAVRLHRGLQATADHNIRALVAELPAEDAWRSILEPLATLSAYATAYRYPTPGGRRNDGPPHAEVTRWLEQLSRVLERARSELTVMTVGSP